MWQEARRANRLRLEAAVVEEDAREAAMERESREVWFPHSAVVLSRASSGGGGPEAAGWEELVPGGQVSRGSQLQSLWMIRTAAVSGGAGWGCRS